MIPILLPIGVLILGGLAYKKAKSSKGAGASKIGAEMVGTEGLTPEQAVIYETALNKCEDPAKLNSLASVFRQQGFAPQALMLEKRARLRSLPQETKQARRAVYRQAMRSTNKAGICAVADAYENDGALSSAKHLREYAAGLP